MHIGTHIYNIYSRGQRPQRQMPQIFIYFHLHVLYVEICSFMNLKGVQIGTLVHAASMDFSILLGF